MSESQTLLPCPFCGEASNLYHTGIISCDNCGAEGPTFGNDYAARWNRRAALQHDGGQEPVAQTMQKIVKPDIRPEDFGLFNDEAKKAEQYANCLLSTQAQPVQATPAKPVAVGWMIERKYGPAWKTTTHIEQTAMAFMKDGEYIVTPLARIDTPADKQDKDCDICDGTKLNHVGNCFAKDGKKLLQPAVAQECLCVCDDCQITKDAEKIASCTEPNCAVKHFKKQEAALQELADLGQEMGIGYGKAQPASPNLLDKTLSSNHLLDKTVPDVTDEMIDAGAEVLYGTTKAKAIQYAKLDKFESCQDRALEVFKAMITAAPTPSTQIQGE